MLAVAVIGALVAYIAYTQPAVKALIYKCGGSYLKKYDAEIDKLNRGTFNVCPVESL